MYIMDIYDPDAISALTFNDFGKKCPSENKYSVKIILLVTFLIIIYIVLVVNLHF